MDYEYNEEGYEEEDPPRLYDPSVEGPLVKANEREIDESVRNLKSMVRALNDELVEARKLGLLPTLNISTELAECKTNEGEKVLLSVAAFHTRVYREI